MNYEGILEFHGTWRSYQARVLQNVSRYLSDDKIHIVAAPGSGKTTLGIELIKRLNANTLILAPSITIREQWAARIQEAFLCDGYALEDYVSLSLKQPKAITVATYQALHSAMTRFCGTETPGEDTAPTDVEEVDYSDFDLVRTMKNANIELLCLDECHHLRSEWWKSLEAFQSQLSSLKTISLTATPPYDSTPAMWTRYMNMCGEIDEEITIPELVKEGSLCPHQDYVYFNYPTAEETKEIQKFEERSSQMLQSLMQDSQLLTVIETHKGLNGQISDDLLLDDPEYLEAILIYLQSKNAAFPARLQRLLGAKKLPAMGAKWMERLLQGILYDDTNSYLCDKVYREMLIDQLKSQGLIEKKKVILTKSAAVEKLLTNSLGKANSIRDIVFSEYDSMGSSLRLLILTDYIRKEYEKAIGNPEATIASLGVLPPGKRKATQNHPARCSVRKRRHHTGKSKRSAAAANRRKNQTHVFRYRQPFRKRLLKSDRHGGRARPHCSRYCHFCTGRNAGSDRHEIPARRRLGFSLHQFPDSRKLCRLLYAQQPDARPRHPRLERRPEQNEQYLASRLPKAPERSPAKPGGHNQRGLHAALSAHGAVSRTALYGRYHRKRHRPPFHHPPSFYQKQFSFHEPENARPFPKAQRAKRPLDAFSRRVR